MKLGLIGLGKMGGNMARRLIKAGHQVIGYNLEYEITEQLVKEISLTPSESLKNVVALLDPPRAIWVMVPSGKPTEQVITDLAALCEPGDVIIDGGNSNYKESIRRAEQLAKVGIDFVDAGVSGGVWGLKEGYSLMIGGKPEVVERLRPIFESLAPSAQTGWGHVGPSGAGHFVKMVHNGIEYGLMEAYAEGFELMRSKEAFELDLYQIAEIWRTGSVVRSWLLDLAALALKDDPDLQGILPYVSDSGEGRWTVMEAIDDAVPLPVIATALFRRFESRQENSFALRLLSALRNQFGGHKMMRDA